MTALCIDFRKQLADQGEQAFPGSGHQAAQEEELRRHRTRTTDSQHEQPVAPNLLNREFSATAPNTRVGGR